MRYFLKIEDCDEEGNPTDTALPMIAEGEYSQGALVLHYLFDGAEYTLTVSENCVLHDRLGDTQMSLCFRLGELTCGVIKSGGMNGNLNIFTHELKIALSRNGCNVRLVFSDGASGGEKVFKNITAFSVK